MGKPAVFQGKTTGLPILQAALFPVVRPILAIALLLVPIEALADVLPVQPPQLCEYRSDAAGNQTTVCAAIPIAGSDEVFCSRMPGFAESCLVTEG